MGRRMLDSTANAYPAITSREYPQVYRLTAIMATVIQPEHLRSAVWEALPQFPVFSSVLERGRFWYYMEERQKLPEIRECRGQAIRPFRRDGYQFRFLYERNRIHLEVFHALTDGYGAFHFLHTVCLLYCRLTYHRLFRTELPVFPKAEETDAYSVLPMTKKGSFWGLLKKESAFEIPGKRISGEAAGSMTVQIPLEELRGFCRARGLTIGELFTAACIRTLREEYRDAGRKSRRKLRISVPVNLRPFFGNRTERNFFICISIEAGWEEQTFEELLALVQGQFQEKCTGASLLERVAGQLAGQNAAASRYAPLCIKNWFLRRMYHYNGYSTMVLSNLGRIEPPGEISAFISGYGCALPVTEKEPVKMSVLTYRGTLEYTVVSCLGDSRFCEALACFLRTLGLSAALKTAGDYSGACRKYPAEPKEAMA